MKQFKYALMELYKTLDRLFLFRNILASVVVFLSFYLALMLIDTFLLTISPLWSLIPGLGYLTYTCISDLSKRASNKKLIITEKSNPELSEKLRTAADNIYLENPVVNELQEEVLSSLDKVRASSFFNVKQSGTKMLIAVILCFLIVFLAAFNFKLMEWGINNLKKPRILIGKASNQTSDTDDLSASNADNTDLYGEESVGKFGDEDVYLSINSMSFELTNVRSEEDIPKQDFQEKFPDAVDMLQECDSDCVLKNNIPIEQQELVKNYFMKLAQS